ncbi:MAG: hypothetical protein IJN03_02485 [Bacilli bacterium]|nr:hypothetical protein [Bacilli bacterium]
MIVFIEIIIFCLLFTMMVYLMSKNPIATLYNYPPKIQKKVKSLPEYKDKIPTNKNKIITKLIVTVFIIIIVSLVLRYVNGYETFKETFLNSLLIWTSINIYDVIVLDLLWFCQSEKFIFKGTEDIKDEYHNYWFHIKEGLIGELIGTLVCIIIGLVVGFIL